MSGNNENVTTTIEEIVNVDQAAIDKAAAEAKAAAEKKAADDKAAAEKKAAEDKAKAEKKAAEDKAAAEKKAADEKAAAGAAGRSRRCPLTLRRFPASATAWRTCCARSRPRWCARRGWRS